MSSQMLFRVKIGLVSVILVSLAILPAIVSGHSRTIHVDIDASGEEDGSFERPYSSISEGLDAADDGDEVYVHDGKYRENIVIPKGVSVKGNEKDRDRVVIDGDRDDDEPTVGMKNRSSMSFVTVEDGRYGILVRKDAKAKLYRVTVRGAREDGIHSESASHETSRRLYAEDVEVKDSGRAGIFSENRYVVLVGCYVHGNAGDGIDFLPGTKAWIEDTRSNGNGGSGWKVVVDGSDIWSKNNQFRDNGHEGILAEGYGSAGKFGVKKSKTVGNDRFGIALVAGNAAGNDMWKSVFLEKNSAWDNRSGAVSAVIRTY